jgi:oxygen-independent coproporphyrinogen-3 oxidase
MLPLHRISGDGEGWGGVIEGSTSPGLFPLSPASNQVASIDKATDIGETMMMGLRLTREGVSRTRFQCRFGRELTEVFGAQIERLINLGLLEWAGADQDGLRLTRRGRLLGNQVFMEFI